MTATARMAARGRSTMLPLAATMMLAGALCAAAAASAPASRCAASLASLETARTPAIREFRRRIELRLQMAAADEAAELASFENPLDQPFTPSVRDLSDVSRLNNRVRYPTVENTRVRVAGWGFEMMVFYEPFAADEGCRPGVIYLHPAQVFQVFPNEEYWNTCSLLATHSFLCILSMEFTAQFAQGIDEIAAEGLAMRGLAMWRQLYRTEHNNPASPFYQRVCPRAASSGYSLGGGSAQILAYLAEEEDGIACVAPIHGSITLQRKVNTIKVPLLIGSAVDDTVTPVGPIRNMYNFSVLRPPVVQVVLRSGHAHILGSVCGNNCPMDLICCWPGDTNTMIHIQWMVPFFKLYLQGRREYGGVVWDRRGETAIIAGIADQSIVEYVNHFSRVAVTSAGGAVHLPAGGGPVGVDVLVAMNERRCFDGFGCPPDESFELTVEYIASASGVNHAECAELLTVDTGAAVAVAPLANVTMAASIGAAPGLATPCEVGFRVRTGKEALSSIVKVAVSVDCELSAWSAWTGGCGCCAPGGAAARAARRAVPTSRLEGALRVLRDVEGWASGGGSPLAGLAAVARWAESGYRGGAPLEAAAREVRAALAGSALIDDCAALRAALDLNGDGAIGEREAQAALGYASQWLGARAGPGVRAVPRAEAGAAARATVSRSAAVQRGGLATVRRPAGGEDEGEDIGGMGALMDAVLANADVPVPCERSRTFVRSAVGLDAAACESLLAGTGAYGQTRACDPDCEDEDEGDLEPPTDPPAGPGLPGDIYT